MFPVIGNAPSLWSKMRFGVPDPSPTSNDPACPHPWGLKTDRIEMKDGRIKPKKVKNKKFGLLHGKILRNMENTPWNRGECFFLPILMVVPILHRSNLD